LLVSKGGRYNLLPRILEGTKNGLLGFTHRLGLDSSLVKFATRNRRLSNLSKSIYMSTAYLDRRRTVAYLSSFAGVKSYPHGGVEVNRENLSGAEYEKVRDRVIEVFSALKTPGGDAKMLEWICRREDLYRGEKIAQAYPDIVFELKERFWHWLGHSHSLFGKAQDHILAPGGHKKNAVFLLVDPAGRPVRPAMSLMDIAPTILDILAVKGDFNLTAPVSFKAESRWISRLLILLAALGFIARRVRFADCQIKIAGHGYELSIFTALPRAAWGTIDRRGRLRPLYYRVSSHLQPAGAFLAGGFSLLVYTVVTVLILPVIRGYYLYGTGDTLGHLDITAGSLQR